MLCAFMWVVSANAQNINVYQWSGGSGNWDDPTHWTHNGLANSPVPTQLDQVYIPANKKPIQITLDNPVFANAIYTAGTEKVSFRAKKKGVINLLGSLVLSPATEIADNIEFQLEGTSENALYQVAENLQKKIHFSEDSNYQELQSLPKSGGACPFFTIVPDPLSPTCNGFNNGVASVLEPIDGTGPYTYQWIGGPSTRQWLNVGAGTYTVIVIDLGQGGLPCNIDVFVNEPGPLTVFSMNASPPLCADVCNGSASPIVIGGNGGYSFTWSSGEIGNNASQLCPVFNLEIEDLKGCIYDTTFTFPNPPDTIKFDAAISDIDCFGNDNGAIDVTISGGVPPFIPSWTGPNGFSMGAEDITNLEPGDYTISVVDGNGCLADSTFTIAENPILKATTSKVDNVCAGGSDGAISISPSGGSGIYSYSWSGPNGFVSTDQNINGLVSGTYELTLTDDALCTFVIQVNITEPSAINIDFASTDVLCAGGATGSATASASGGTPAYTYEWSGPNGYSNAGPSISNILAGSYIVSVTDGNTCLKIDSILVLQPDSIQLTFTAPLITCHNGSDGSIDLEINGGAAPYTVLWSGPGGFSSSDEDITGLASGNYSATVTDVNGCSTSGNVDLANPAIITLSSTVQNSTCAGGNTGAIDLTVNGGVAPFTFVWTGPGSFTNTNEDISNLAAGAYNVIVTDNSGCDVTGSFEVSSPLALSSTFTKVNASCNGTADGSITTTPAGGTAPYTFLWIGPAGFFSTNQNISGLLAGTYSLQLSDANGCAGFFSVNITQPSKINIANVVTNILCFGASTGKVDVTVSGGSPGYTYSWVGPNGSTSTQPDIINVPAGMYTLTVTDNIGCSKSRDFNITQPQEITVDATVQNVICSSDSNGSISIAVSNGVAPYSYAWTGPSGFSSSNANITNLIPGSYSITVTDANLCSVVRSYTIDHTVTINADASLTDITCYSGSDGAIDLTISGGAEPYQVSWSGVGGFSSNNQSISNLLAGDYTISISDDNGCQLTQTFTITQPEELLADIVKTDIVCAGDANGSLSANISGGTNPYIISWVGPNGFASANADLTDLDAGNYQLTVVDANNCSVSEMAEILSPDSIQVDISISQPSCLLDNGQLTASVTGGVIAADYTYVWTDSNGDQVGSSAVLTGLAPGDYTLTVSDDNGCSVQSIIQLVRTVFNVAATVSNVTCHGADDGSISVSPTNGNPPFTYSWLGPNGFTSSLPDITNLTPGNYTLSVEDGSGCMIDLDYDINQPDEISTGVVITPISCLDETNGIIALTPAGGTPGYAVIWSGPDGFSSTLFAISGLSEGSYTASVVDVNGCTKDTTVLLDPGFDFSLSLNPTNPSCADGNSGSITLDITSTDPSQTNFLFEWEGPAGYTASTQNISNVFAGVYTVTVTSENGCVRQDTTELFNPEPIDMNIATTLSSCGQSNGSASATVSGGSTPYVYAWINAANDTLSIVDSVANVPAGIYDLAIVDGVGCEIHQFVVISDDDGSIEVSPTGPTCAGGNDGALDITITGAAEPITYQWSDGNTIISTDEDLIGITAGSYIITATGANGCTFGMSIILFDPAPITATAAVTLVSCNGSDGAIDLAIAGGNAPYTIDWTGPNGFNGSGTTLTDLESGTYYFSITDVNSCATSDSVFVGIGTDLIMDPIVSNILCGGDSTGSILLNVSGGIPPYQFEWTATNGFNASTEDITNLIAGDYAVTITDGAGCQLTSDFTVTENDPVVAIFTIGNPDCNADNGSISVNLSGGSVSDTFFIQWSDQDGNTYPNSPDLTDLAVGIYDFTASDDNGCSFDTTIVLSNTAATISVAKTDVACFGTNTGTIELTIADVSEPYTVSWAGPNGYSETGTAISGLEAGEYTYTIISAEGCTSTGLVEITSPEILLATAQISNACFGASSGTINITITGGVAAYNTSWTGPDGFTSSDEDLVDLAVGLYSLTITDQNGCSYLADYEVFANAEIQLIASVNNVLCNGQPDGEINLSITGGQDPYQILWSGPDGYTSTEDSIADLSPGDYLLSIVDSTGCGVDSLFTISQPDSINIEQTVISAGCSSPGSLGYIELVVTGGTPDYTIAWSGPAGFTANTLIIENLEPGIYTYTITDNALCEKSGSIEILGVTPLIIELTGTNVSCHSGTNGSINTTVFGGLEPYFYNWSGPRGYSSNDFDLTDIEAGTYILLLSDSAGCSAGAILEITQPDSILIDLSNSIDASCNTSDDGAISAAVSGGTSPYEYSWTGPDGYVASEMNISELYAGTYSLTVIDANECSATSEAIINYTLEITADAGQDQSVCESDLPFTLHGSGINVDEFLWTNIVGDTLSSDSLLNLTDVPGAHTYILSTGNGLCTTSDTVSVQILSSPDADAGPDHQVFPEEIFTLGGDPTSTTGSTYLWTPNPNNAFNTSVPNPTGSVLESTTFIVYVKDNNECVGTDTTFVEVLPEVIVTSGFTPNGDGINDTWIIDNMELFPNNTVQIFNRWGIVLYSQNGYNSQNAWDGFYEGKPLPVGTYYYAINLHDERFPEPMTGPLTIYR